MVRIHQGASGTAMVLSESWEPFFILCAQTGAQTAVTTAVALANYRSSHNGSNGENALAQKGFR